MKFSKRALVNAPLRGSTDDNHPKPLWQKIRESGKVPKKFAFYTPDDVEELDDPLILKKLYLAYSFTNRVPNDDTAYYMETMSLWCLKKLVKKGIYPPYVVESLSMGF